MPSNLPQTFTQTYTYDAANRLSGASEDTTWSQTYLYDARGNRWVSANTGLSLSSFTPTTSSFYDGSNRLNFVGAAYDNAGNQTQEGGYTFVYDGENRLTSSTINAATTTYSYDGDGRRVSKVAAGLTTVYAYDVAGDLAAEYNSGGVGQPACTTCYLTADHLGSTRLVTNSAGAAIACHDFLPSGEEIPSGIGGRGSCYGAIDGVTQKFTGKERDLESGMDFFGARYMSGAQGRFTSPDLPANYLASLPQSWNKYAYALNNPLAIVDPDGQFPQWVHEQIIDRIPGLSANDKAILKAASADADSLLNGGQKPSAAYRHAQMDGLEFNSTQTDPEKAAQFVEKQLRKAIGIQAAYAASHRYRASSLSPDALYAMGLAIHTVTDSASRFHNGIFSHWYGGLSLMDYFHIIGEPAVDSVGGTADKNEGEQRARVTSRIIFEPSAIDQIVDKIRQWFHLKEKRSDEHDQ